MTDLTRRNLGLGIAASVLALPVASLANIPGRTPVDPDAPITPAEYLRLMEANGWRPLTGVTVSGNPAGVFERTATEWTWEHQKFLQTIQRRIGRSGHDFYDRTARYLFEQGRIDRDLPLFADRKRSKS